MSKVLQRAGAGFEIAALESAANLLNFLAVNRALAVHHFESVVIGRIVAAGDHDSAVGVQMEYRIIEQGVGTTPRSVTSHPAEAARPAKRRADGPNSAGSPAPD